MPVLNPTVSGQIVSVISPSHAGARDATTGTANTTTSRYSEPVKYSKIAGAKASSFSVNRYWSTSGFNDITLNATALSDMASVDNFKLCLIQAENDLANVEAVTTAQTGFWRTFNTIHLDYTAASAGYSHNVIGVSSGDNDNVIGIATANIDNVIDVS